MLALAACSGEVDNPLANGPVALGVTAEIGQVMSRAASTSFETNDAIGVIPAQTVTDGGGVTQYAFSYDGSKFNPGDARYYFADTDEKTFHAYYPYTASVSTNAAIALDTRAGNQVVEQLDEQRKWRKNDYLAATATASASKPTASYTGQQAFRHVMAQVVLTFQAGGGLTDLSPLTSYTLTTPLAMDGTFSPATGTVTLDDTKDKATLKMESLPEAAGGKISSTLILLPQEVADGQLGLDVTYGGQTYRAALSIPEGNALTAGTSYAYTVTVRQSGLSVDKADIQDWNTVEKEVVALPVPPIGDKPLTEAFYGDYYFSDGTLADGGSNLTDAQAKACIGIVFMKGQAWGDATDYSTTGIGQEKCHGYVFALTDAHLGSEGLAWATEEASTTEISSFPTGLENGYAQTQAIRDYAKKTYGENAPLYFPAAYACLQYGTEDGPEWARCFAAPASSSGWFLPSAGLFVDFFESYKEGTFNPDFAKLKEAYPADVPVGLFSNDDYWMSEQYGSDNAIHNRILSARQNSSAKSESYRVRAILAF